MPDNFIRPFHFWCQKVLPLVFDDSLSYYEVLGKVRDHLNHVIDEVNTMGDEFEEVKTNLSNLKNYVDEYFQELDVKQAISDKLDDMVETGEMDAIITPIFAAYANPIFVGSVDDMIATHFAYVNHENNKVYVYNQVSDSYVSTGKEFGGVVSSVDDMEDNDKYYALDSNGVMYEYDYPQEAYVSTQYTFGGYRYGVNSMRPISNSYVLTTDSHVYVWNGREYSDTGVVYSVANTAFIWRQTLTSENSLTSLLNDGWYSFEETSVPQNTPNDMLASGGMALTFSTPNGKRVLLKTYAGGSWLWDGQSWLPENECGYVKCEDCNEVNINGCFICDSSTLNSPNNSNGFLKSMQASSGDTAQLYVDETYCWHRTNNGEWHRAINENDQSENNSRLNILEIGLADIADYITQLNARYTATLDAIQHNVELIQNTLLRLSDFPILTNDDIALLSENNKSVYAHVYVAKTDSTLSENNVAADAKAVGEKFDEVNADIASEIADRQAADNSLERDIENERKNRIAGDQKNLEAIQKLADTITSLEDVPLVTENNECVSSENNKLVCGAVIVLLTDKTLTKTDTPADAKAVGEKIASLESEVDSVDENTQNNATSINKLQKITEAITGLGGVQLVTHDEQLISSENNALVQATVLALTTDKTLTEPNGAANAKVVGERLSTINSQINETTQKTIENNERIEKLQNTLTASVITNIATENGDLIYSEQLRYIGHDNMVARTDKTLTLSNVPADAKTVGDMISPFINERNLANYREIIGAFGYSKVPIIDLRGELPLDKSNVNISCSVYNGPDKLYVGKAKLKVQGSSSIVNPEKNYTLTLENPIEYKGYYTNKWNLKCNYIDPSQIRNLLAAKLWYEMNTDYAEAVDGFLSDGTNIITTENSENIETPYKKSEIAKSPMFGASDGGLCAVTHNGEFHGVYTLQLPKGPYMLGMDLKEKQFLVGVNQWFGNPFTSIEEFNSAMEIEENSPDMTEEVIYNKVNQWITNILAMNGEELLATDIVDINLVLRYMVFARYIAHYDGIIRNMLLYSYNGGDSINFSVWDMDGTFGNEPHVTNSRPPNQNANVLWNDLFRHVANELPTQLNATMSEMHSKALNQSTLWKLICGIVNPFQQALFTMDFYKWPQKGKTISDTPLSILLWNLTHEEYALQPIV